MKFKFIIFVLLVMLPRVSFGVPTITDQQDLDFGDVTFVANGTVVVDTNGSATVSGGAGVSGITSEAQLLVSGLADGEIINSITPPNTIGNVGQATVQIKSFTCSIPDLSVSEVDCSNISGVSSGTTSSVTIHLGATASLPNGSLVEADYGPYTDTFGVVVWTKMGKKKTKHNATATVNFSYVRDIAMIKNADLNFGVVALDPTQDSVVRLNPGGTIQTISGSAMPLRSHAPADFSVTGDPNAAIDIILPANNTVYMTGVGDPIAINNFADNSPSTFDANGDFDFNVGADVTIDQNQTTGSYTGSFNVEVNYQ